MSDNKEHCIDVCNKLLRGARSAVETYDAAIEKYASDPALAELRRVRDEHSKAVLLLQSNVANMGGKPSMDSGAWGTFANAVQASANLFGEESAIMSLIQGEKHGLNEYEEAIKDDKVMSSCKTMFQSELLPRQREHIATLERLQKIV